MSEIRSIKQRIKDRLSQNESLLLRGSAGSFIVHSIGALFALILQVTLARVLGVDSYGNYTYVWSWVNVVVMLGTFGFQTASVKYVSKYAVLKQWTRFKAYLSFSRRVVFSVSCALSLVFALAAYFFVSDDSELLYTFICGAVAVPVLTRLRVGSAELKGLKKVIRAMVPEKNVVPIGFTLALFGLSVLDYDVTSVTAMGLNIAVSVLSLGIVTGLLAKEMPASLNPISKPTVLQARRRKWFVAARDMLLIGGFHLILFRADVIMVGAIISPTESGLYNVASRIAGVLSFTLFAVNTILSPMTSELHSSQKREELQHVVRIGAKATFYTSALMMVAIFVFRFDLLQIFGEEFVASEIAFLPLLIGQLANAFAGPSIMILNMTDQESTSAWILGIGALLNVVLNFFLIHWIGLQGAAIATMITMVSWNTASVYYVQKKVGVYSAAVKLW